MDENVWGNGITQLMRGANSYIKWGHRRADKSIVFLDEAWVNQKYTVSKCWVDSIAEKTDGVRAPIGKGSSLIVLHAGAKNGFVPEATLVFQTKMSAITTTRWMSRHLKSGWRTNFYQAFLHHQLLWWTMRHRLSLKENFTRLQQLQTTRLGSLSGWRRV